MQATPISLTRTGGDIACFDGKIHGDLLWSAKEVNGKVLATGYSFKDGHYRMRLWQANGLEGPWSVLDAFDERVIPPNTGFTEACLVPREDGTLVAFCRVDGDSVTRRRRGLRPAWKAFRAYRDRKRASLQPPNRGKVEWFAIGMATPPYTSWEMTTHRIYLKGPAAIPWRNGYVVAGRFMNRGDRLRQVTLFHYDGAFHPLLALAEGRDGSYPGLAWHPERENELIMSYYSDHERLGTPGGGKSNDAWVSRVLVENKE